MTDIEKWESYKWGFLQILYGTFMLSSVLAILIFLVTFYIMDLGCDSATSISETLGLIGILPCYLFTVRHARVVNGGYDVLIHLRHNKLKTVEP